MPTREASHDASQLLQVRTIIAIAACTVAAALLTGCGTGLVSSVNEAAPGSTVDGRIQGTVYGGQQPVSGSTIQLYAVTTEGYDAPATALLTAPVTSAANGTFSITGDYSCTGVDQVYIVATGGNPGLAGNTNNGALALMAALGSCSSLLANASTTFINLNEVTTVAGAWSLAQFMNSPTNAGTSATNVLGVENAFATANKIANFSTGTAPGPALPAGATLPVSEVNTLANILSSCVNTNGSGTSGTPCAISSRRLLRQVDQLRQIRLPLRSTLRAIPVGACPRCLLWPPLPLSFNPRLQPPQRIG